MSEHSWLDRLSHIFSAEPKDRDELIQLLHDAKKRDLFDAQALTMIEGALQVAHLQVRDIMVPRTQMVLVERGQASGGICRHGHCLRAFAIPSNRR